MKSLLLSRASWILHLRWLFFPPRRQGLQVPFPARFFVERALGLLIGTRFFFRHRVGHSFSEAGTLPPLPTADIASPASLSPLGADLLPLFFSCGHPHLFRTRRGRFFSKIPLSRRHGGSFRFRFWGLPVQWKKTLPPSERRGSSGPLR